MALLSGSCWSPATSLRSSGGLPGGLQGGRDHGTAAAGVQRQVQGGRARGGGLCHAAWPAAGCLLSGCWTLESSPGGVSLEALARGTRRLPRSLSSRRCGLACKGTGCVAGVLLQPSGAKVSIAQAMRDGLLPAGLGQRLLEAQVASGSLWIMTNQRLSVEEAVKTGLVAGAAG